MRAARARGKRGKKNHFRGEAGHTKLSAEAQLLVMRAEAERTRPPACPRWMCPYCGKPVGLLGRFWAAMVGVGIHNCDFSRWPGPGSKRWSIPENFRMPHNASQALVEAKALVRDNLNRTAEEVLMWRASGNLPDGLLRVVAGMLHEFVGQNHLALAENLVIEAALEAVAKNTTKAAS